MVKMLTLSGEDVSKLRFNDLKREKSAQTYLRGIIRGFLTTQRKVNATHKKNLEEKDCQRTRRSYQLSSDKVALLETYAKNLDLLIDEIDYQLTRRAEPTSNSNKHRSKKQIREENAKKRRRVTDKNLSDYRWKKSTDRDDLLVSWDREKFMLIAQDNGYQTEEAVIADVGKELKLDRTRARMLLERGRFTWGQILYLGAMMQMTPKEFCDTFLAGYFVEQFGEYRADYQNLCKEELLRRAIKPTIFDTMEKVEVGSDGKPLDEEEWFD